MSHVTHQIERIDSNMDESLHHVDQVHTHTHTHTHIRTYLHTHTYTHTDIHTHTHTCTHAHMYTHAHTYTHTRTQKGVWPPCSQPPLGHCFPEAPSSPSLTFYAPEDCAASSAPAAVLAVLARYAERVVANVFAKWLLTVQLLLLLTLLQTIVQMMMN